MMAGFDMMALMNEVSQGAAAQGGAARRRYEVVSLPLDLLVPNPLNGYVVDGVDALADAILLAGRVLQCVVVEPKGADGRYVIISGHRRVLACRKLVEEGHAEFAEVPALVEYEKDACLRELMLIYSNSSARVLTDAEKMYQAERATQLLKELKAAGRMQGRVRDAVGRMLGVTSGQLARYAVISGGLSNEGLRRGFEAGRVGVSVAYEAASLTPEGQEEAAARLTAAGALSLRDVAELKVQERKVEEAAQREVRRKDADVTDGGAAAVMGDGDAVKAPLPPQAVPLPRSDGGGFGDGAAAMGDGDAVKAPLPPQAVPLPRGDGGGSEVHKAGRLQRFYLSHPYTGDEEGNRAEAARIQCSLQERFPDVVFFNPLAMFAPLEGVPYEQVMRLCMEVLRSCDAIVMAGRYSSSNGCQEEYAAAHAARLRVLFYVGGDAPLCSLKELRAREAADGEEDAV